MFKSTFVFVLLVVLASLDAKEITKETAHAQEEAPKATAENVQEASKSLLTEKLVNLAATKKGDQENVKKLQYISPYQAMPAYASPYQVSPYASPYQVSPYASPYQVSPYASPYLNLDPNSVNPFYHNTQDPVLNSQEKLYLTYLNSVASGMYNPNYNPATSPSSSYPSSAPAYPSSAPAYPSSAPAYPYSAPAYPCSAPAYPAPAYPAPAYPAPAYPAPAYPCSAPAYPVPAYPAPAYPASPCPYSG